MLESYLNHFASGRAIELHGTICQCCGFDFDKFYGSELAKNYIEIHHTRSIAQIDGPVDPATNLAPLCSNWHSMVHRKRGEVLLVTDLEQSSNAIYSPSRSRY